MGGSTVSLEFALEFADCPAGGCSSSVCVRAEHTSRFFVVHAKVRRLCADVRPHLGRREHVLVDSASELLPCLPSSP